MVDRAAAAFSAGFSARLDALASALERSGAEPAAVGRLLETASAATLRALALTLLLDGTGPRLEEAALAVGELRDAA